jgi:hypothetical protein
MVRLSCPHGAFPETQGKLIGGRMNGPRLIGKPILMKWMKKIIQVFLLNNHRRFFSAYFADNTHDAGMQD